MDPLQLILKKFSEVTVELRELRKDVNDIRETILEWQTSKKINQGPSDIKVEYDGQGYAKSVIMPRILEFRISPISNIQGTVKKILEWIHPIDFLLSATRTGNACRKRKANEAGEDDNQAIEVVPAETVSKILGIIQTKFPEVVVKDRERQVKDVNKAITKVIAELKGNRLSDGTLKKKGKATILTSEPPSTNNDPEDNEGQSSTNDAAVNSPSAVGEQEIDARRSSIHDNTSAKIIESRPDHPSPIGNHTQQLELPQTSKANCSPMPQERQLLILAPPAPNAPISQPKSSLRLPPNSMLITVEDYLESQVQMSQEALLSQRLHMPDSEDPSIQPSESYSQQLFNERDGWINTRPRPPVGRLIYTQDGSQAIVPPIADSIPMFPPAYNLRPVASSTPKKKIGNGYGRGVSTRSKTDRKLKL